MTIRTMYNLILVILVSTMFSCSPAIAQYSDLANEITSAVKVGDREALTLASEQITNDQILKEDGLRYLKLKMTALTFAGEYQNAFHIIDEYITHFPEDYELLIGQAIIANRIGKDAIEYFFKAYNIIKEKSIGSKTEFDLVVEYYLAILLNLEDSIYIQTELLPNLSSDGLDAIEYYNSLNKKNLLLASPIGFVASKPVPSSNGKENEEWWN